VVLALGPLIHEKLLFVDEEDILLVIELLGVGRGRPGQAAGTRGVIFQQVGDLG